MCGIHGFAWKAEDDSIDRMVSAAAHRGPDGRGTWGDRRVTLGHNLLAITDTPSQTAQPWHHAGKILVYNGEVYNYRDLRKGLAHKCKTDSDTEVLAAGLHERGLEFLKRVDGMFALAWYDPGAAELTLARDSNGARPLYAAYVGDRPCFSSEIRSLLALGVPRTVCKEAFRHYYHAGLVAGPLTMFEGVLRLVPGQVVTWNLDTRATDEWNLNDSPVAPYAGKADDVPDLLALKLRQSVKLALSGRRQIALLLSGGMDSSAVLHEAGENLKTPPRTYSTRFALPHERCRHNEDADAAARLSRVYHTKHREVAVDEAAWVDGFERAVTAMEEPRQGKSYAAYYKTYEFMRRQGVIVTLSGDGGDELLLGYKHQAGSTWAKRFTGLRSGHRELPDPDLGITVARQCEYLDSWVPTAGLTGDDTNDFMYTECLHTLAEDFLVRNDKLGAAFGMEARFPMMCKPFRDFCRSIPSAMKVGQYINTTRWDVNNKMLLRRAYHARLPLYITAKGKTGWRAPTDDWIVGMTHAPAKEGPVRAYVRSALADHVVRELFGITDDTIENRYLNNRDFSAAPKAISKKPGVGPGMAAQKELFAVLTFAAWYKSFGMNLW